MLKQPWLNLSVLHLSVYRISWIRGPKICSKIKLKPQKVEKVIGLMYSLIEEQILFALSVETWCMHTFTVKSTQGTICTNKKDALLRRANIKNKKIQGLNLGLSDPEADGIPMCHRAFLSDQVCWTNFWIVPIMKSRFKIFIEFWRQP